MSDSRGRTERQAPLRRRILLVVTVLCSFAAVGTKGDGAEFMMRARINGQMVEGEPLAWSDAQVLLMGRDGRLYDFKPKEAKEARKTSPRFFGYSMSEMKRELQREFDKRYDVSTTQHYIVVHPAGERDQWAGRFEDLYKRFTHYFRVRGFRPHEPKYPLVAVVFRDKREYDQHAAAAGMSLQPNVLGHYEWISNRVYLHDMTTDASDVDWSENANLVIHEATHQTAYNVGIHTRFAGTPSWLVEGLATMFEARGVWNAQYDRTQSDRINVGRLLDFKHYVATRRQPGTLRQLIASDRVFKSDAAGAYAEAWALSFYLCETRPRLYAKYLAKVAERPMFGKYSDAERVADFEEIFGNEWKMFETKFLRYMEEVK